MLDAAFQIAAWVSDPVARRSAKPYFVQLPCELDGDKNGIDDFLARHGANALQRLIEIAQLAGYWVQVEEEDPLTGKKTK